MDQSEADWGHWSLNNASDISPLLEPDLTSDPAQDSDAAGRVNADQVLPGEEGLVPDYTFDYDEELGQLSGSADSQQSETDILEEIVDNAASPSTETVNTTSMPSNKITAICEYCGVKGDRELFYSKLKKFCSIACSRNFTSAIREGKPIPVRRANAFPAPLKGGPSQGKRIRPGSQPRPKPQVHTIPSASKQNIGRSFDWGEYLKMSRASAAPVTCFKHCVLSDSWENISVGMKVEVINTDCNLPTTVYWIATVLKLAGYKALMRYEGFSTDASKDFWTNLCTGQVQPVGWCAANNKSLVPPRTIQHKYLDWKDFLVKRLTGARTLPHNFRKRVQQGVRDCPLKHKMTVEVVDKNCVSAMRVATVAQIVGGSRVRLQYKDSQVENDDFWCHRLSPLIHPVGWSQVVGHKLHASPEYKTESANKVGAQKYSDMDATPEMFLQTKEQGGNGLKFMPKMKLEAIDPLNLSCICVATVMKVLRNDYLMIGIDGSMAEGGFDWFCYHTSSPCIFPVGFCEINGLELTPPRGYKGKFSWFEYLKQTHSTAAPVQLFDKIFPKHGFKPGMKLEAVDLMEPRLICVACVTKVVGRLLRIHFDGWESSYDQWVDSQSPDIYPVGWCEMVNYHLEGPRTKESPPSAPSVGKKRKSKSQMYRGPRKKRKPKMVPLMRSGLGQSQLYPQQQTEQPPSTQLQHPPRLVQQCSVDSSDFSHDSLPLESPPPAVRPEPNSTTDSLLESEDSLVCLTTATSSQLVVPPAGKQVLVTSKAPASLSMNGVFTSPTYEVPTETFPAVSETIVTTMSTLSPANAVVEALVTRSDSPKLSETSDLVAPLGSSVVNSPVATTAEESSMLQPASSAANLKTVVSPGSQTDLAASLPSIATMLNSPTKHPVQNVSVQSTTAIVTSSTTQQQQQRLPNKHQVAPLIEPSVSYSHQGATQVQSSVGQQQAAPLRITQVVAPHMARMVSGEYDNRLTVPVTLGVEARASPRLWSVLDVCQFLKINDSGAFCDGFRRKNIDGSAFLSLTKEQIVNLTGMKVGPSLKIYNMIQLLKQKILEQECATVTHQGAIDNATVIHQGAVDTVDTQLVAAPKQSSQTL